MRHKRATTIAQQRYSTVASLAGAAGTLAKPVAWKTMRKIAREDRKVILRIVSASQAKRHFGEVIQHVYERGEVQIIERAGIPVAAVISMSDLERLYPQVVRE